LNPRRIGAGANHPGSKASRRPKKDENPSHKKVRRVYGETAAYLTSVIASERVSTVVYPPRQRIENLQPCEFGWPRDVFPRDREAAARRCKI